jgi:hypothetical protein
MVRAMNDGFAAVAAEEERVAAACAAAARWLPAAEADLHALAAAHLATARALTMSSSRPIPWRGLYASLQALLAAVVGTELGTLLWLRRQEQRLVDAYVALEGSPTLTALERQRLRRVLVPTTFERFGRVDRWIMLREEQGAYA